MSTAPLSRQDFARLVQDRLIKAGEDRPLEYDASRFTLIPRGADRGSGAIPLEPFHQMYLGQPGDLEFVLKQFLEYWKSTQRAGGAGNAATHFGGSPAAHAPPQLRARRSTGLTALWLVLGGGLLLMCGVIALPMVMALVMLKAVARQPPRPGPGFNLPLAFPDLPQRGIPPGAALTEILGGEGGGEHDFYDRDGRLAVGLAYQIDEHWDNRPCLAALQPIFDPKATPLDLRGERLTPVVAKEGYVVGGLLVDADKYVNAVKIIFVRRSGESLDLDDSYESDWLSTPTGKEPQRLAGEGERVLGVHAKRGLVLDAVGLIVRPPPPVNDSELPLPGHLRE